MRRVLELALSLGLLSVLLGAGAAHAGEYETLRQRILDSFESERFDAALSLLEDAMQYEADFDPRLRLVATHLFKVDCQFERALVHSKTAALAARIAGDDELKDTAEIIEREIRGSFGRLQVDVRLAGDDWDDVPGGQGPLATAAQKMPNDADHRRCMQRALTQIAAMNQAWAPFDEPQEVTPAARTLTVWLPIGQYRVDNASAEVRPDADTTIEVTRAPDGGQVVGVVEPEPDTGAKKGGISPWIWVGVGAAAIAGGAAVFFLTQGDPETTPASTVDIFDMPVLP